MSVTLPVTQRRYSLPGGIPCEVELPRFLVSTFHLSLGIRLSSQVRHQLTQVHFCVSRLEAAFHRGLHASLVLQSAHTLDEEIGIATNILGRSESDSVDSILDYGVAGGWKTANPKREPSDKIVEFARW